MGREMIWVRHDAGWHKIPFNKSYDIGENTCHEFILLNSDLCVVVVVVIIVR